MGAHVAGLHLAVPSGNTDLTSDFQHFSNDPVNQKGPSLARLKARTGCPIHIRLCVAQNLLLVVSKLAFRLQAGDFNDVLERLGKGTEIHRSLGNTLEQETAAGRAGSPAFRTG